ncbi:MAG: hypothetical protein ABJA94_04335 [Rhodoglobus sp.]
MAEGDGPTSLPRPASVTVVPLLLSVLLLGNLLISAAMFLTDGLPDPIVVFATDVFGWYPIPLAVFFSVGILFVVGAFFGWRSGVRRLTTRPGRLGLSRALAIAIPAVIGLVMPSVWWQVGLSATPDTIDRANSTNNITLAVAALVLPAGFVGWHWLHARNTLGAWESTGVTPAAGLTGIGDSNMARTVAMVAHSLRPALARQIAHQIIESLRFHSAYLPNDTVYQFRMPNGALLTMVDKFVSPSRRTLNVTLRTVNRIAYTSRNQFVRPKSLPAEGGWFAIPDEKTERSVASLLAYNVQQAFLAQDDVVIPGAVVIDPALPPTRIG